METRRNLKRNRSESPDLEQLIRERRVEKREILRQKLRKKLRLILDRRNRVYRLNTDPFPEGAFDRLNGNQVWDIVLEYMMSDECDMRNANLTCSTFSAILENRIELSMMSKALEMFKIKGDKTLDARRYFQAICFQARGVCKAWKEVADFHLFHSTFTNNDWFLKNEWLGATTPQFVLESEECIEKLTSLEISPGLIRSLQVKINDNEKYFRKLMEFLQIYGHSVWFLDFQSEGDLCIAEACRILFDVLELTPNLKGLALSFTAYNTREMLSNVPLGLIGREFPVLKSLLHLDCKTAVDGSLVLPILKNSVNLRSVNYNRLICWTTDDVDDALEQLPLQRYQGYPDVIAFINPMALIWPLAHLTLMLNFLDQPRSASVLFPAINRFHKTLQHLVIFGAIETDAENESTLNLPHLKSFETKEISKGTLGFDHLLQLKSLEQLIVRQYRDEDENAKVKVKGFFDSGEMEKSNVWDCFPSLIRVKCGYIEGWTYRPQRTTPL